MGQVIDFSAARGERSAPIAKSKCRCGICGADLWHISESGEVCCADCDTVCPYRIQTDSVSVKRQAECSLTSFRPEDDFD